MKNSNSKKSLMIGIVHTDGSGENNPPLEKLSDLYDELLNADQEHGDVAVINDDFGWCMSAHRDGRLVFEKLGSRGTTTRHMKPLKKENVLSLWRRLVAGEIDSLLLEPW